MRRSGGISKNLLLKKLESKVYVSFLISLYKSYFRKLHNMNEILSEAIISFHEFLYSLILHSTFHMHIMEKKIISTQSM